MSPAWGVVIVAATLGDGPTAPPPKVVVMLSAEAGADADVERYLRSRLDQTFRAPPAGEPERQFDVRLSLRGDELVVTVSEAREQLAERRFARTGAMVSRLGVWLFVRSTLLRALGGAESDPAAEDAAPAPLPEVAPAPPVVEAAPPAPIEVIAERWRGWAMATSDLASTLWTLGARVGVSRELWRGTRVGGEAGYAMTPARRKLAVHHFPLSLFASTALPLYPTLEVGALVTADGKLVRAADEQRLALGALAGPFVELTPPRESGPGFVARLSLGWQLVRQRYLYDGGRATETPWSLGLACGAVWP